MDCWEFKVDNVTLSTDVAIDEDIDGNTPAAITLAPNLGPNYSLILLRNRIHHLHIMGC